MADEIIDLGNLSEFDNSFIGGSRSGGGGFFIHMRRKRLVRFM